MKSAVAASLALVALCGCSSENGRVFADALVDELRGPPDAEAIARSTRFEGAGIQFEYPAALRHRHEVNDSGEDEWSFEYGMYTLTLQASDSPVRIAMYFGVLQDMLEGGRRIDAEDSDEGRTEQICGHAITSTVIRVKMMDSWSRMEGFDLPAPPGQARLLILDDELIDGQPSALGRATRERVLGTLRCDASFVPVLDDEDEPQDAENADTGPPGAGDEAGRKHFHRDDDAGGGAGDLP